MDNKRFILSREKIIGDKCKTGRSIERLDFAFAINKIYGPILGILMTSIIENNKDMNIGFNIFYDEISDDDKYRFQLFVDKYPLVSIGLYKIDETGMGDLYLRPGITSLSTYYRLIMPEVLYPEVKRLIYLDADMLCVGDLKELKNVDFEGNIVMAVTDPVMNRDTEHKEKIEFPLERHYFNAGFMLIDSEKWHQEAITDKTIKLAAEKKLPMMDQDTLNLSLMDNRGEISKNYNYVYSLAPRNVAGLKIVHFAGGSKPWTPWSEEYMEFPLYDQYRDISLWADFQYTPKNSKQMRLLAKSLWRNGHRLRSIGKYINYIKMKVMHR